MCEPFYIDSINRFFLGLFSRKSFSFFLGFSHLLLLFFGWCPYFLSCKCHLLSSIALDRSCSTYLDAFVFLLALNCFRLWLLLNRGAKQQVKEAQLAMQGWREEKLCVVTDKVVNKVFDIILYAACRELTIDLTTIFWLSFVIVSSL